MDIRRNTVLASPKADVWLETTLSYTSNGRVFVRHSLRHSGNGEATVAVDGRRGRGTLFARSVAFPPLPRFLYYFSKSQKCSTAASGFTFQLSLSARSAWRVLAPQSRKSIHFYDHRGELKGMRKNFWSSMLGHGADSL